MPDPKIVDAATLILIRDPDTSPAVLMGQRSAKASFMPNKYVFPGGAVDADDHEVDLAGQVSGICSTRLEADQSSGLAATLVAAAIRELWEETGLALGQSGNWNAAIPSNWQSYADAGFVPSGNGIHFVFRAITPPGRTRRFDARFLIADAARISGNLDDFSGASGELSNLRWVAIEVATNINLPFITEVVLAEIAAALPNIGPPASVPFFNNRDEQNLLERIGRRNQI